MIKESFRKALKRKATDVVSTDEPERLEKLTKEEMLAEACVDKAISRGSTQNAIDIAKLTGEFSEVPVTNISLGDALKNFSNGSSK